jgi:ribosomal protein L16/L10AE
MLLKPKSRKFKKHHYYGVSESVKSPKLVYGRYGLVCKEGALVTSSQLNGWVMTSKRALRRKGKL